MRKTYIKPIIEAQELEIENNLMAGSGVGGTTGLDGVTPSNEKPDNFSKAHNSIWDFDEEE